MFIAGKSLYAQDSENEDLPARPVTAERVLDEERQTLLDEGDFNEYRVRTISNDTEDSSSLDTSIF